MTSSKKPTALEKFRALPYKVQWRLWVLSGYLDQEFKLIEGLPWFWGSDDLGAR